MPALPPCLDGEKRRQKLSSRHTQRLKPLKLNHATAATCWRHGVTRLALHVFLPPLGSQLACLKFHIKIIAAISEPDVKSEQSKFGVLARRNGFNLCLCILLHSTRRVHSCLSSLHGISLHPLFHQIAVHWIFLSCKLLQEITSGQPSF